jgi:hypothetical protein
MLLALVACPRCGHRDEGIAAYHRRSRAFAIGGLAIAVALLSAALFVFAVLRGAPVWIPAASTALLAVPFAMLGKVVCARFPTHIAEQVQFSRDLHHLQHEQFCRSRNPANAAREGKCVAHSFSPSSHSFPNTPVPTTASSWERTASRSS